MVVPVTGSVPDPASFDDPDDRAAAERALAYMDLRPGQRIEEIRIDRVFIGSCTNARIEDLRAAAAVVEGRRVDPRVTALVVPGSASVRRQAEEKGSTASSSTPASSGGCGLLDVPRHEPGHPLPGERCASTSNRTSKGARAVAAARTSSARRWPQPRAHGHFVDVRPLEREPCLGMKPLRKVHGRVAIIDRPDVDTDQIIPKQFLKRIERTGYGEFLFNDWRFDENGDERPGFELNRAEFRAPRSSSPGGTSGAARRASTRRGPCRTSASTRSWRRRSATSSARTRERTGCSRSCCPPTRSSG